MERRKSKFITSNHKNMSNQLLDYWDGLRIPKTELSDERIITKVRKQHSGPPYNQWLKLAAGFVLILINVYAAWNVLHSEQLHQKHSIITESLLIRP